jgi:hypothetical protein
MDDLPRIICTAGAMAVLEAREIWRPENDNQVREEFLSALMAANLHRALGVPIRVEGSYTAGYEALELGLARSVVNEIGGFRGDILIYDRSGTRPESLIEVKKFDEGVQPAAIWSDLTKARTVGLSKALRLFAGVLVCETSRVGIEERENKLRPAEKHTATFSAPIKARNGEWRWSFGCIELLPEDA